MPKVAVEFREEPRITVVNRLSSRVRQRVQHHQGGVSRAFQAVDMQAQHAGRGVVVVAVLECVRMLVARSASCRDASPPAPPAVAAARLHSARTSPARRLSGPESPCRRRSASASGAGASSAASPPAASASS
eukprot:scaffold2161_cov244-Pinguiococcus_pyrenoidosus.AAC.2